MPPIRNPKEAVILSEAFFSGVEGPAFPSRTSVKNFRDTTLGPLAFIDLDNNVRNGGRPSLVRLGVET
jgi:hypothetical protein